MEMKKTMATLPTAPGGSPWLQKSLSELTQAMRRIVDAGAVSFAQFAEMYYVMRPELISIVEHLYPDHRSLAELYDQLKSDAGVEKLMNCAEKSYASFSETYDPMESGESEVDDPESEEDPVNKEMEKEEVSSGFVKCEVTKLNEQIEGLKEENKSQKKKIAEKNEEKREIIRQLTGFSKEVVNEMVKESEEIERVEENKIQKKQLEEKDELKGKIIGQLKKVSSTVINDEMVKLREEIERLKEENKIQIDKLAEKDEEKREVIRQLSLAMDILGENLKQCIAKESPKKSSPLSCRN